MEFAKRFIAHEGRQDFSPVSLKLFNLTNGCVHLPSLKGVLTNIDET